MLKNGQVVTFADYLFVKNELWCGESPISKQFLLKLDSKGPFPLYLAANNNENERIFFGPSYF